MHLLRICSELVVSAALVLGSISPVQALTLNFSAILVDGTCSLRLDRSHLDLGQMSLGQLRANQLIAPQAFTLFVHDCANFSDENLNPNVKISGTGVIQDNKWLFRSPGSAQGTGILVIQSDTLPDYAQEEVKDGSHILLTKAGPTPVDQSFTFYAGGSCGGTAGCALKEVGDVTATLMFTFEYQ